MAACLVCGARNSACSTGATAVIPVDPYSTSTRKPYTMADLREYRVVVNGHETTAMLDEQEAARLDAVLLAAPAPALAAPVKARSGVPNKAALLPNKAR